jgi:fumarate hydratase class II
MPGVRLDTHAHDGEGEWGMTGRASAQPAPGATLIAAIQVLSSGVAVTTGGTQGKVELNVFRPILISTCLHSPTRAIIVPNSPAPCAPT